MEAAQDLTPTELSDFLLAVAPVRPVFIWGAPGIGKSALVERFAADVGMACVSLLGSQLAPEDIIGVPRIEDGVSHFCPPAQIARAEPFVLFLDELNACSPTALFKADGARLAWTAGHQGRFRNDRRFRRRQSRNFRRRWQQIPGHHKFRLCLQTRADQICRHPC